MESDDAIKEDAEKCCLNQFSKIYKHHMGQALR